MIIILRYETLNERTGITIRYQIKDPSAADTYIIEHFA